MNGRAVHPHGCGERAEGSGRGSYGRGSSPRVWGTRGNLSVSYEDFRFIPTGVGNAAARFLYLQKLAVHPHGCGERLPSSIAACFKSGSSPRVWGTPKTTASHLFIPRFIPTGVGNAREVIANNPQLSVHPHGCGERSKKLYLSINTLQAA